MALDAIQQAALDLDNAIDAQLAQQKITTDLNAQVAAAITELSARRTVVDKAQLTLNLAIKAKLNPPAASPTPSPVSPATVVSPARVPPDPTPLKG